MVRCFFLVSNFFVVEDYELSQSISHLLMCHKFWNTSEFYLSLGPYLIFASRVSVMMFNIRLLSDLLILLSTHHVTQHLSCCRKLRQLLSCNLILKIKFVGKYSYFSSATFCICNVKISYLKLPTQTQTLKAVVQNQSKKSCFKSFKFLTKHPSNFTKNVT